MTRGLVWRKYVADDATEWALLVDADHAGDPARGWSVAAPGTPAFPRASRPREVVGLSPTSGRLGTARVATVTADLWTGAATDFFVEANDQSTDTMVVIQLRQESMRTST